MKYIAFLALFLVAPIVNAAYYAQDYDPDYLPYNFEEATNWKECEDDLKDFDSSYTSNIDLYLNAGSAPGSTVYEAQRYQENAISQLESNKVAYGGIFKSCIEDGEEAEEKRESKEAAERFEQQRLERMQRALDECDFDYFETLSDREKMATYDERKACEDKANEPEPVPVQVPEPAVVKPVVPTYVPPAPVETSQIEVDPEPDITKDELATSAESTTTPETIEVTPEELDEMVEQRLNERLGEESEPAPEPEKKPALFKRVTNFLFGWLF